MVPSWPFSQNPLGFPNSIRSLLVSHVPDLYFSLATGIEAEGSQEAIQPIHVAEARAKIHYTRAVALLGADYYLPFHSTAFFANVSLHRSYPFPPIVPASLVSVVPFSSLKISQALTSPSGANILATLTIIKRSNRHLSEQNRLGRMALGWVVTGFEQRGLRHVSAMASLYRF